MLTRGRWGPRDSAQEVGEVAADRGQRLQSPVFFWFTPHTHARCPSIAYWITSNHSIKVTCSSSTSRPTRATAGRIADTVLLCVGSLKTRCLRLEHCDNTTSPETLWGIWLFVWIIYFLPLIWECSLWISISAAHRVCLMPYARSLPRISLAAYMCSSAEAVVGRVLRGCSEWEGNGVWHVDSGLNPLGPLQKAAIRV